MEYYFFVQWLIFGTNTKTKNNMFISKKEKNDILNKIKILELRYEYLIKQNVILQESVWKLDYQLKNKPKYKVGDLIDDKICVKSVSVEIEYFGFCQMKIEYKYEFEEIKTKNENKHTTPKS